MSFLSLWERLGEDESFTLRPWGREQPNTGNQTLPGRKAAASANSPYRLTMIALMAVLREVASKMLG
jgi:hypothetical protein